VGGFSDDGKNKDSRARAVSRGLTDLFDCFIAVGIPNPFG
jgi:hypothetical protein